MSLPRWVTQGPGGVPVTLAGDAGAFGPALGPAATAPNAPPKPAPPMPGGGPGGAGGATVCFFGEAWLVGLLIGVSAPVLPPIECDRLGRPCCF